MCPRIMAHKEDCDCSACLLRREEKRKWNRAMKNPTLRMRLEVELATAKADGWYLGYAEAAKRIAP